MTTQTTTKKTLSTSQKSEGAKIVKGLETKSAKIRALAKEGWSTADIARFLGILYQHARNVLTSPLKSQG